MKILVTLCLTTFVTAQAAIASDSQCAFFSGIKPAAGMTDDKALDIINSDPGQKSYMRLMDAKVVSVQDTGKRYRCDCYDYLVKFKDKNGSIWVNEVNFVQGKIPVRSDDTVGGATAK